MNSWGLLLTRGREGGWEEGGGGGGAPGKELGLMVLFGLLLSDLLNRVFCMRLPLSVPPGVTFQIKKKKNRALQRKLGILNRAK